MDKTVNSEQRISVVGVRFVLQWVVSTEFLRLLGYFGPNPSAAVNRNTAEELGPSAVPYTAKLSSLR
jgi:hypothetical protein